MMIPEYQSHSVIRQDRSIKKILDNVEDREKRIHRRVEEGLQRRGIQAVNIRTEVHYCLNGYRDGHTASCIEDRGKGTEF